MKRLLISISCFFLITSSSFSAVKSSEKIRKSIESIDEHFANNKEKFAKNPLEGLDLLSFSSRGYLLFYRGLGYWLVAAGKKGAKRVKMLELALDDFRQATTFRTVDNKRLRELNLDLMKEYLEESFILGRYQGVLDYVEKLPKLEQRDPHWIAYYAVALFKTKQELSFTRLVKTYPSIFRNTEGLKQNLKLIPRWEKLVSLSLEDTSKSEEMPSKEEKENNKSSLFSQEQMLSDPKEVFNYLESHSYFKESAKIFKEISNLYLSLLEKPETTKDEKRFISLFQKASEKIPPNLLESFIPILWKKKYLDQAEYFSSDFLKTFKGHPSQPKILYDLGRIQEDSKQYSKAFKTFTGFMQSSDDTLLSELALFRIGWTAYLDNNFEEALRSFEVYLKSYADGRYSTTCEYFIIKLQDSLKIKSREELTAKALAYIQKYPLNIYALTLIDEWSLPLSTLLSQLSSAESFEKIEKNNPLFKVNITTIGMLRIFNELKDFGLKDEAVQLLAELPFDEKNDLLIMYLAAEYGKFEYTHGQYMSVSKIFASSSPLRGQIPWRVLFPDAHIDLIKEVLKERALSISPYLVLAIIRQESAFNSETRSSANAQGLMQLIPSTAKNIADEIQFKNFDLKNKKDNLRLGISEFVKQLKNFKGRLDYALSAYNAGLAVTSQWVDMRGHLGPIEFTESIPYQETRYYIKNIVRNYMIYKMIYENSTETKPIFVVDRIEN